MASIKGNKDSDEAGFKRLVELEAEYRTQRSAEQLHAIASFPRLFDDFPYPVLISAAILKLADYYRQSNNIQRHAILQVIKKSQPHLKSISNVDETIKRITPVLKSNDQLARAITLRVFGCMATIAYDRIDVYHNVIHSLDSSEAMEVSAAIYAADRMCAHSQRFCAIISGKLAFMVRDAKTPLPMKRRLIRIFGHMFEDIALARLARKTCLDILDMNQDGEYTVAILRTLTRLASHSLVDVNQQVCLLLEMAQTHPLQGIRRVSLICLGSLAQKQIDFSSDQIKAIFEIATTSTDEKSTLRATCTLHNIFRFTSVMPLIYSNLETGSKTMTEFVQLSMQVLRRFNGSSQPSTSAPGSTAVSQLVLLECYSLLSVVLSNFRELELDLIEEEANTTQIGSMYSDSVRETTQSMEQFLDGIWTRSTTGIVATETHDQSKTVLWLLITLALEEGSGVKALLSVLLNWLSQHREQAPMLGKALLKLAQQQPASVYIQLETLMSMLGDLVESPKTEVFIVIFRTTLESLVLHRSKMDMTAREAFESRISGLLEQFGAVDISERPTRNHWELYQLATFSLQAGWPSLAVLATRNLEKPIQSAPFALWLTNVQTVALIESSLQSTANWDGTNQSVDLYLKQQMYSKVVASLEEIEAYQFDRTFQLKLCSLRLEYLEACQLTVTYLSLLSASLTTHRLTVGQNLYDLSANGGTSSDHSQINPSRTTAICSAGDESVLYKCASSLNRLAHDYTVLRTFVTSRPSTANPKDSPKGSNQQSDTAMEVQQTLCLILAFAIQRVAKSLSRLSSGKVPTVTKKQPRDEDTEMRESGQTSKTGATETDEEDVFDIDPLLIPLLGKLDRVMANGSEGTRMVIEGEEVTRPKTFVEVFRSSSGSTLQYLCEYLQGQSDNEEEALSQLEKGISIVQQLLSRYISFPIWIPQEFFVSRHPSPKDPSSLSTTNQFGFSI